LTEFNKHLINKTLCRKLATFTNVDIVYKKIWGNPVINSVRNTKSI